MDESILTKDWSKEGNACYLGATKDKNGNFKRSGVLLHGKFIRIGRFDESGQITQAPYIVIEG